MPRGAAGSRTSLRHHPVQDSEALLVTRLLDHLALAAADRVRDPDRLLRGVQAIELSFVVHKDLLQTARVKAATRARPSNPDLTDLPATTDTEARLRTHV